MTFIVIFQCVLLFFLEDAWSKNRIKCTERSRAKLGGFSTCWFMALLDLRGVDIHLHVVLENISVTGNVHCPVITENRIKKVDMVTHAND